MANKVIKNRVAELLAIRRRDDPEIAKLNKSELAEHLGISRGALYHWLDNKSTRRDDEAILAFMDFFELDSLDELFIIVEEQGDEENDNSPETETALAVAV